ncbi:MAG: hypothetical protein RO009_23990 [Pseudorhodoplanes sp.]|jgi:hypothetical protein|nr:hypothetical protein [Pseudorhodoplanes sp.]
MRKFLVIGVSGVAVAALAASLFLARTDSGLPWLPLTRSDLIRLLAGDKSGDVVKIETPEDLFVTTKAGDQKVIAKLESRFKAEKSRLSNALASGETVWVASNPEIPLSVIAAGEGERIHTLRVNFPIVNYTESQSKRALDALSALFMSVYPEWTEANEWPKQSLKNSWDTFGSKAMKNPNDRIVKKTLNGFTSATFGIPPDIVVYTITARENCIPNANHGNPFQRIIC